LLVIGTLAVAATLGGCAARPFSAEEKFWFDKAQGPDVLGMRYVPVYPAPEPHFFEPEPQYPPRPYR
jgi:hypothetical protein